jgi:hypothetical protein
MLLFTSSSAACVYTFGFNMFISCKIRIPHKNKKGQGFYSLA